jgi:3-oxoacyl-[acyl-carrier protein] reductase
VIQERVAIITGAGRGIGKAIAFDLARSNHQVIIAEFAGYGEQAALEIQTKTNHAIYVPVDVSVLESVKEMVGTVIEKYGRIDILVNNAGIRPTKPFLEITPTQWERVLKVNLTGLYHCCACVAPFMIKQNWGRIINISSLAAQQGSTAGHSHYAASKAGMIGLTKSLAREFAPSQVTVNCVTPGWIDTEGWEGQLDGHREEYASHIPLGRLGQPEDVAYAVSFLASEQASYLTGITLPVNGGLFIS